MIFKIKLLTFFITFFLCLPSTLHAGTDDLKVDLYLVGKEHSFPYYNFNENIALRSTVKNISTNKAYQVTDSFISRNIVGDIQLTSPSGFLLLPSNLNKNRRKVSKDAPPLGYVTHNGKLVQAIPCRIFKPNAHIESTINNIRSYFTLTLPGVYSAKIQFSTIVFKNNVCGIEDIRWQGLLQSKVHYFYYEGSTSITIAPEKWSLSWKNDPGINSIKLTIVSTDAVKTNQINLDSVRLNATVIPEIVDITKYKITLTFNNLLSLKSLPIEIRKDVYPVVLSGVLKNGQPFGGARLIQTLNQ